MKLFDKIMFYISVPKCVGCGNRLNIEEKALCKNCKNIYNEHLKRNCSRCAKKLNECSCTNHFMDSHYVHKMIKVYRYMIRDEVLPTNNLIYCLKRDYRKDVIDFLSDELFKSIQNSVKHPENYIYTAVPRRKSEIIKYGYDHAEELAKAVAEKANSKYVNVLKSKAKNAQKKASSKSERFHNAKFVIRNEKIELENKNVILIDDIVTTGASMGMAASLLKILGAKEIIGAAIAIAYKDYYVPQDSSDRFKKKK